MLGAVMNDRWIVGQCIDFNMGHDPKMKPAEESMIFPFMAIQVNSRPNTMVHAGGMVNYNEKLISYGTSSFGYDARLAPKFKIFTSVVPGHQPIIDPKMPDDSYFIDYEGDSVIMPPHSFMLGCTLEYFRIPDNILVICLGKSTYARCGLIVNVTPLEPGWHGHVTIEISNTTPLPAKVYANEGIAQFIFLHGDKPAISYADRKGKYQGQQGVTPARA